VCLVSRRDVMVELLTTIRAGKWHVVTASKCRNLVFQFLLKNRLKFLQFPCAVIFCGCMEADEKGFWSAIYDAVYATVMHYCFTVQLRT
jgi:hypothetical protein